MNSLSEAAQQLKGPIGAVKSNDLSDEQIIQLWVPFDAQGQSRRLSFFNPNASMATLVLGGKGSGKTHLLRFYSFPVQGLRYAQSVDCWTDQIADDGYLGVYTRAGGLNGSRFSGKGYSEEVWKSVFAYYLELWFGVEFLKVIQAIFDKTPSLESQEGEVVAAFCDCFDTAPQIEELTFDSLMESMNRLRKEVDVCANDVVFGGELKVSVCCSAGALIFGFPKAVKRLIGALDSILFSYSVDEFENFLAYQQECVNTLVREREPPVTFRIGARSYGMKSYGTNSAGEDIRVGSEYEELHLDACLRGDKDKFKAFALEMVVQRTGGFGGPKSVAELENCFALHPRTPSEGQVHHLRRLKANLRTVLAADEAAEIVEVFGKVPSGVLQKAGIYSLYQNFAKGSKDLTADAHRISAWMSEERRGPENPLSTIIDHFKSDFEAQLRRNPKAVDESMSLEDFVVMSEGLPRVFLTIIKNVFAWADFESGRDMHVVESVIAPSTRRRGLQEASHWFLRDVPQSGSEGQHLVDGISRLATLFRLNRFADKPTECSLIQFSVPLGALSDKAKERIKSAENRCLLIRCLQGEKDRNSKELRAKYHLNRVLSPMFELPIGRRGTARFSAETAEAIFGESSEERFGAIYKSWDRRLNWPFGKKVKYVHEPEVEGGTQSELF